MSEVAPMLSWIATSVAIIGATGAGILILLCAWDSWYEGRR